MDKLSNKSKLSKKLKIISIASAIVMCSTISADIYRASASPVNRLFRGLRGVLASPFRRTHSDGNINTTNTSTLPPRSSSDPGGINSNGRSGIRGRLNIILTRLGINRNNNNGGNSNGQPVNGNGNGQPSSGNGNGQTNTGNRNGQSGSGQSSASSSSSGSLNDNQATQPVSPLDKILSENYHRPPLTPTAPQLDDILSDAVTSPPLTPTAPPLLDTPEDVGTGSSGVSKIYPWKLMYDAGNVGDDGSPLSQPPPLPPRKYKKS